jgi:hypothetical protein
MRGMTSSIKSPDDDLAACRQLDQDDMTYDDDLRGQVHKGGLEKPFPLEP